MVVGKPQRSEPHCLSHAHTINIESDYGSHSQGRERYQYSNDNDNGGCNDD
ncbi:hypothetical protein JCM19237_269 [Photobacterium aphoticum]|uniref:Uncharacterized protein n=1 Tax=Photobacterium aphoticum TaxID=754436 RepID=A0A090R1A7_9GAMM|nr:hypothetical protein JCM19237_269 [Photobacterium aphoticum]